MEHPLDRFDPAFKTEINEQVLKVKPFPRGMDTWKQSQPMAKLSEIKA